MRQHKRAGGGVARASALFGTALALLLAGAAPAVSMPEKGDVTVKVGLEVSSDVPSSAQWAEGAGRTGLSDPRAREFREKVRMGEGVGAAALEPSPVQSITPEECFKHSSSKRGKGYAKGRFASCRHASCGPGRSSASG